MSIHITHDMLIKDVQENFNDTFPFLKIEFFRKGNRFMPFKPKKNCIPSHLSVGSAYLNCKNGKLEITPKMTVKDLEKTCGEQFGLSVQVYRKSGNVWLETTMTENWSMNQQNDQGSAMTLH